MARNLIFESGLKCWEPEPRWFAGKFQFVQHRFPIRGGITQREVTGLRLNYLRPHGAGFNTSTDSWRFR